MDEETLEKSFRQLKNEIPINQALKRTLRGSFANRVVKRRSKLKRPFIMAAAAAVIACFAFLLYSMGPDKVMQRANAASLRIFNQLSFVEIGGGSSLGVAEYKGNLYLPVAGKGLYLYNDDGFHRLYDKEVESVRVSRDGKQLVFAQNGTIGIYNLTNRKETDLVKGDNRSTYYEQPNWSPDGTRIIFTKRVVVLDEKGVNEKESSIYAMGLADKKMTKLADGAYPSYVTGTDAIVFQKGEHIVFKNLQNGKERIIDKGKNPAVSPDGYYVTYVKVETKVTDVGKNAKVQETVENVWVADTFNAYTKKKVTTNFPRQFIDVQQWIKQLQPTTVPQVLALEGQYSYYEPVWDNGSGSIFVLKNNNGTEGRSGMRLTRIDFTTQKLKPADTVRRFLQALIVRDDDYAKSLMKNPPPFLTISNPHQVGYRIISMGQEKGRQYVEAESQSEYTANPYYTMAGGKYYLKPAENGYMVDEAKFDRGMTVMATDDGAVYLQKDQKKEQLFKEADLPRDMIPNQRHRFASLAFSEKTATLYFTIQAMQGPEVKDKSYIEVLSYDTKTKGFRLIDKVTTLNGMSNVGVESLIINPDGTQVALDLFSDDDKTYSSYVTVYNVDSGKGTELSKLFKDTDIQGLHTIYWSTDKLLFTLTSAGQQMTYSYDPKTVEISSF